MAPNDKYLRDISGDELGLLHDLNRTRLWVDGCLITETRCEDCAADGSVEEDKIAIVRAKLLGCTLVIHYPASSPGSWTRACEKHSRPRSLNAHDSQHWARKLQQH
jgi:hypothetical protein